MKKVVSMMFLCVCLFLAGCKKEGIAQASVDNIFKSLEKAGFAAQVVPFTPTATDDINDLLPLSAVFANTQVVGWGEATHGSAEFQSMKHRAFQLLSTRLNFRALVIEENFSAVIPVNEYVLTGTGHVNSLLAGLRSNMFKTLEFKQLVEWMKTYNTGKAAADKLQLWGMDAQNTGYSAKAVQQMVAAYEPGYLAEYNQKAVAFLQDLTNYPSEQAALAALPELQAQWANIRQHIEGNSHTYINGVGSKGYQLLQQHLAVIGQALHQFTGFSLGMNEGFARRDKHMADNVKWVENYMGSGSKLMVWAHNGHINVQPQDYFGKGPIEVLGTHLKSQYGKGFYAVAFVFAQGDFEAVNANTGQLQVFTLPLYKETVLSNALSRFGKSSFFYDLQGSSQPALYQVFNKTYPFYQLGAGYDGKIENALMDFNLAKEFDGFVFVNTTKASNKL